MRREGRARELPANRPRNDRKFVLWNLPGDGFTATGGFRAFAHLRRPPGAGTAATGGGAVFAMREQIGTTLGRSVDLVAMNGAPLDLLHRVLRDGVRVADRAPQRRMEFELQARTQYFDFLPILLRYRESVLRRA